MPNPHYFTSTQEIKNKLEEIPERTQERPGKGTAPAKEIKEDDDVEIDRSPDGRFIKYKKEVTVEFL